jgi:hypothetical protein
MKRAFSKHNHEVLDIDNDTNEIHLTTDIEDKAKEDLEELREEKYSINPINSNIDKVDYNIEKIQSIIKEYEKII